MVSWFSEEERSAVDDFWKTYEDSYDQLVASSLERMRSHPEFGPLLQSASPQTLDAQRERSRQLMRNAVAGDWDGYEAQLRAQGATYARSGISFRCWYDVLGGFQKEMVPRLISRFSSEPTRLARAINAMQTWMDQVMAILGEEYVKTKEELLAVERQRAEAEAAAARRSEARHRLLFQSSPQPMWVFDRETLRFLAVNEAAIRHYGYSREQFLGMTIRDIRPPEDLPALMEDLQIQGPFGDTKVWRHRKKDGKEIEVELSAHGFTFDERPARLVLAHDVTERRQLEEQLRQSQKMEAVGQLAGGVAHDFNNLLTAMLSFSRFIADDLPPDHPSQADLQEVLKAGERAAALTKQLLAFSRREVVQPQPLDVNEVVTHSKRMLERIIGEDIELVTALAPSLGPVMADRGHLEQVILNIVVNARHAMRGGGGKLTIETELVELDATYVRGHLGAKPGQYVLLAITDTGVGMDEALQARIFEPFFTTKGPGEGTGLGLSTVFGIVKQAGGDIRVYSSPGRGSTFKVYFPVIARGSEEDAHVVSEVPRSGNETILLVEDDDAVRAVARRALSRGGYNVLEAATPEQAVQLASDARFELLLSDVVMPQMNGQALAAQLRVQRPELRVLFMSGYTGGALTHQGILSGDTGYIQKPFTPDSLLAKVRAALDTHSGAASER